MTLREEKQALRKEIAALKRGYSVQALQTYSLQRYIGKDHLRKGTFDILEPETTPILPETSYPELLIVPGIAFDRQLNRLGRGKGYYDRLLSQPDTPAIGVAFSFQLRDRIPTEPHDRKMTRIITDSEIVG